MTELDPVTENTKQRWIEEQEYLKSKLILEDKIEWDIKSLKYIGGVDISFIKENNVDACASLIVLEFPSLKIVYEKYEMVKLTLPYISGFLAFREVPYLISLIDELKSVNPSLTPQVIMVDGNGYLHPRGFGLASHLGVLCDIPTIGVGKTFLHVDGLTVKGVKQMVAEQCKAGGDFIELKGESGTVWGAAVRSHEDSTNAIFVSQGHKLSLPTTLLITKASTIFRVPEPVRMADIKSRAYLRENPL
eukprot:TRINITY_DN2669_c0_g1_i1.p1 TRINITY_DN2669_c0_g1~~TRINITY_DN2669_c0_g1_i1.p1  ORF type:complete len:247 (+),score=49.29 TRINITY_DN2669_c0_g1_i1:200-940(+)